MNPLNGINMNTYGNMYGYQPQYQPRQRLMKCFPVTSIEEAKAAMIDVDGSVTVFPDIANGKIYTKAVDLNGLAVMQVYELAVNQEPHFSTEQRMDNLEAIVNGLREDLENVKQSNAAVNRAASKKQKSTGINEPGVGE